MTKAVFAGKNVEEFSLRQRLATTATVFAVFAPLLKNLFLCHRPRNRGDDHRKNHEPEYLRRNIHLKTILRLATTKSNRKSQIENRKSLSFAFLPKTLSTGASATGDAIFAEPSPRFGECVRGSRQNAARLLQACVPSRCCRVRNAF